MKNDTRLFHLIETDSQESHRFHLRFLPMKNNSVMIKNITSHKNNRTCMNEYDHSGGPISMTLYQMIRLVNLLLSDIILFLR